MYGLVIGPYAHGNSVHNRYAENKETVVPRHATKRTNYDRIHPYRPVEPRGVPKQEFVAPPERQPSFNLVFNRPGEPKQTIPPTSGGGQQFNPPTDSSKGVIPPTNPSDSKTGAVPPPDSKGWLADLLQDSLGNPNIDYMKADYIDGKREDGYEAAGESAAKGVRAFMSGLGNIGSKIAPYLFELDEKVVKEEDVDTMFAPLNTRDDVVGAVPKGDVSYDFGVGNLFEKGLKASSSYKNSSQNGWGEQSIEEMLRPKKVEAAVASNTGVPGIAPRNFGRPKAIPVSAADPRVLHSGGLKKPQMAERRKKTPVSADKFKELFDAPAEYVSKYNLAREDKPPSSRTRSKTKINKF